MRRFIRSLAGKTILFIVCIISTIVLTTGIAGIVFCVGYEDADFYFASEEECTQTIINNDIISPYGYDVLWRTLAENNESFNDYEYQVKDAGGKVIATSAGFTAEAPAYTVNYSALRDPSGKLCSLGYIYSDGYYPEEEFERYSVSIALNERSRLANEVAFCTKLIHFVYSIRYLIYVIVPVSLFLMIASFVALMYVSGRRNGTDEFVAGPLHKIPFDLLFVISSCIWGAMLAVIATELDFDDIASAVCISGFCLIGLNILLGLCMSVAGRIKQHTLVKNTIIFRLLKLLWKFLCAIGRLFKKLHRFNMSLIRGLPLIWKTGLAFAGISFLEILLVIWSDGDQGTAVLMWFIEKCILLPFVLYIVLTLRKLQKSGAALAGGDLTYHTDTKGMLWDFKEHGENMNKIAVGMSIAVEDRLKSERMKTDLITNVSHDLKTPLTSIINYASLISEEPCENAKIIEYSEVLVRQSDKLKRLIEDLVEASKASTGNLEVALAPCDAGTFISQAGGEYEEKMQKVDLTLMTKKPEKELRIMADGRRMWRVFDNLMNNICKYALPGTRVYLGLEEKDGKAVITFKNTSREPLDMTEEELLERFTRGDSSRNTEGNGLGLAIAKSMTELQGGDLKLSTDGDLFKAILSFPLI
ncbi:MAG: HAMP domain-containing histidine kinase [Saccharofermentans sp.]|nr:HAMP domain-containing histidine kinase [Saccharofermentans sp.]